MVQSQFHLPTVSGLYLFQSKLTFVTQISFSGGPWLPGIYGESGGVDGVHKAS